jgi:hypothetical protein
LPDFPVITSEFFKKHMGNFHYFSPAVTFGIPGSFSLPFLVPPEDPEAQTSEGPLGIFTSVGVEDEGHCVVDFQQQVLNMGKSLLVLRDGQKQYLILSFQALWKHLKSKVNLFIQSSH